MATINTRRFAVVTGGSSGIGYELAKQFLAHDFDVMIAADESAVHTVAQSLASYGTDGASDGVNGAIVIPQQVDLATTDGIEQLCNAIDELARPVDAIALNAGFGITGRFLETSCDEELKMIRLNCESVVAVAKHVARQMAARGQGRILITSSIAGTMPAPYETVYGATKAFDLSFAEALRYELKDTGVSVTAMQPGPTDTNFFERAGAQDTKVGTAEKDDPALVARQGFEALMSGKDKVLVGGFKSKAMGMANEIMPEPTKAKMHAKQAEPGSGNKR